MRACLTFYRTVALPLIAISLICCHQIWQAQTMVFLIAVFWVKVLTSIIIGGYIALFRSEQFIFFNNLGFSKARLLTYTFSIDFFIWTLMMGIMSEIV